LLSEILQWGELAEGHVVILLTDTGEGRGHVLWAEGGFARGPHMVATHTTGIGTLGTVGMTKTVMDVFQSGPSHICICCMLC
jgi:hypothetical protein